MALFLTTTGALGISEPVLMLILIYAILAIPVVWYARRKGYPWWIFMLTSILLSWFTTLVVIYTLPKRTVADNESDCA